MFSFLPSPFVSLVTRASPYFYVYFLITPEMPVTELAWIPSATAGSVPPALLELGRKGMEAQGAWVAKQASSTLPRGPPAARGAALYQGREDKGTMLITAHWDSAAQHLACVASEENKAAMEAVEPLVVVQGVKFFHIDGVQVFDKETLDSGLLSVVRIGVDTGEEGKRGLVEKVWEERARGLIGAVSGFEHKAGWRIEREKGGQEERDEFVVAGAWGDESTLGRFGVGEGREAWDEAWNGVVLDMKFETFNRIV